MTIWDVFPLEVGPYGDAPGYCGGWAITSYFGGRVDPLTGGVGNHGGMDLAFSSCSGTPIYAPADGTLSQSWDSSGGGNWSGLTLDQDGSYFGVGHAESFAPGNPYRWVPAGELIGYVGTTGGSTGPHAHICYRPPGATGYADPYDLLMDAATRPVGGTPPGPIDEETGMPHQFTFPEGTTYVLVPNPDAPRGFEWQHIGDPLTQSDAAYAGAISPVSVQLAVGDDNADAMWARYTVRNGPHRTTG